MNKYIQDNLQYPQSAKDANIKGIVVISFFVDEKGIAYDFEIVKKLHDDCDIEALRVIKQMAIFYAPWNPGLYNGNPVQVRMTLPISFRF